MGPSTADNDYPGVKFELGAGANREFGVGEHRSRSARVGKCPGLRRRWRFVAVPDALWEVTEYRRACAASITRPKMYAS